MSAVLTAAGLGDVSVTGIDPVAAKRDQARPLGAHAEAAPEAAEMGAFDVVIEAAGSARAFETAYRLLAPGGRLVTVGLPAPDATATIAPLDLVAGGRSMVHGAPHRWRHRLQLPRLAMGRGHGHRCLAVLPDLQSDHPRASL